MLPVNGARSEAAAGSSGSTSGSCQCELVADSSQAVPSLRKSSSRTALSSSNRLELPDVPLAIIAIFPRQPCARVRRRGYGGQGNLERIEMQIAVVKGKVYCTRKQAGNLKQRDVACVMLKQGQGS